MISIDTLQNEIAQLEKQISFNESSNEPHNYKRLNEFYRRDSAIRTLALQALDMQPKPIAELRLFDTDQTDVFLVWSKAGRPELRTFSFENDDDLSSEYRSFIPLSSLPKVQS
jgi:hypothetical protein